MVRLPDQHSTDMLPTFYCHWSLSVSIDQLDKVGALFIPEAYIYILGMQFLVSFR